MKTILCLTLLLLFSTISSNAQVYYDYDNNGNRTSSSIVIISLSMVRDKDTIKKDSNKIVPIIKVYPNPTSGQFTVSVSSFKSCEYATIYLSDASGNLLSTQKTTSTNFPMSIASYNQGTYYLKVIMCNDQYSYKVIKTSPGVGNPANPAKQPAPVEK